MENRGKSFFFLVLFLVSVGIEVALASFRVEVTPVVGADRFETAVRIYEHFFRGERPRTFILTAGYGPNQEEWSPDALCAAPLASVLGSPLFLTRPNSIDPVTLSAIASGGFESGIVVGGPGAVSESVVSEIAKRGIKMKRLGGVDRYHTSALVAQEIKLLMSRNPELCFIASGENFPDAVAAGFLAGRLRAPVLLTRKNSVPFAVKAALNSLNIQRCVITGGEAAVSRSVESSLPSPVRIAGSDRYETSARLVRFAVETHGFSTEALFLATGEAFPDALLVSPAASACNSCVLLASPRPQKQELTLELLSDCLKPGRIYLVGRLRIE